MPTLIKLINDRHTVQFDTGAFDDWCVYVLKEGEKKIAPRDNHYFSLLKDLALTHGSEKIYNDFVQVYDLTTSTIDSSVLNLISSISLSYGDDSEEIDIWFTVLYAGMIAEENKKYAKLKKRIKRLGMHQVLIEGQLPEYAAGFSRGKKWTELDALMQTKGF